MKEFKRRFLMLVLGGALSVWALAGSEQARPFAAVAQTSGASESAPLREYVNRGWSKWDPDQYERHAARPLPDTNAHDSDPAVQSGAGPAAKPIDPLNVFEGMHIGPTGQGNWIPSDDNVSVGQTQVVQVLNDGIQIWDKVGHSLSGPVPINALWSGFGGGCEANNDGDPTVNYDVQAGRWIVSQFSVSTTPYLECVAVSTSDDATGTYYRYAFQHSLFPDYPKLSVWTNSYIETFNMFGSRFLGGKVCAYDRGAMLSGAPTTQRCFQLSATYGGLLASTIQSASHVPPDNTAYVLNLGSQNLNLWKLDVSWGPDGVATLTGPQPIAIAGYSRPKKDARQPGTGQALDALSDRLMYRLNYRNFGNHEAMVVNHTVETSLNTLAVRWYELRKTPGSSFSVYQQSTYAPDSDSRWMGSAAMDRYGNIAVGYSVSSGTTYPSIRFAGQLAGSALGLLNVAETSIVAGQFSQTNGVRWGDYTAMTIDPDDDCTFWYTNQYIGPVSNTNSGRGWHTKIAHFRIDPACK